MTQTTLNAPSWFDLSGRVALVTGAGSGIGQRIALGLAQCGADVACLDKREDGGLTDTLEMIKETQKKAISMTADVTHRSSLDDAVRQTEKELGALSIAVNAAGIANANPAETMEEAQYQMVMDVNMKGVFFSCQAEAHAMLQNGKGSIINIGSISGVIANKGLQQVHYNASKAGVIHMSKSLATEWVRYGIRVNSISPGYTATPMAARPEMASQIKEFENQTPMGRMATPDEIVGPAIFLASDASSYCTGIDIIVDGGVCCW